MRIAHVTDIHVLVPPRASQLFSKRMLGSANLYLFGRRSHFAAEVQQALVEQVTEQSPDAVLCTGDLTAQATDQEFESAHALLAPLFSRQPTALIPGNHDTYTRRAWKGGRMDRYFGEWTGSGDWPRVHLLGDGVGAVAVDASRASLGSAGVVEPDQLARLGAALEDPRLDECFVFVMLHYPLRDRHGEPYGPARRALREASSVERVLGAHSARVGAIVHGHEHHGFRTQLPAALGGLTILDPGASGYAWLPDQKRTAHFNVYTVEDQQLVDVERFYYDGEAGRFLPEPGGAYATGG